MMRNAFGILAAAGLAVSTASAIDFQGSGIAAGKLMGGLDRQLRIAQAGELVPVVIVLKEQAPQDKIDAAMNVHDKEVRRGLVTDILKDTADATQGEILGLLGEGQGAGTVGKVTPLWLANAIAAHVTPEMALELAARDDVWYLHLEKFIDEEVFPVQPGEAGPIAAIECGVDIMGAPKVWDLGYTGAGVVVGMIDTGLCITHPDIVNQIWFNPGEVANNNIDDDGNGFIDDINGWNFEGNNKNVSDQNGHGTHTSGTVAGDGTNGQQTGMAPDAEIMTLKFWNSFDGETTVWNGMQYGVDNGAHVLSASLGWPHSFNPDRTMWRMVSENTFAAGVVTVFAAGNEGNCCGVDSVRTPGDVPDMITVGATNCNDGLAGFSSQGPVTWENIAPYFDWPFPPGKLKPTISAPGDNTLSLSNNCSGYLTLSGTSMATPHVSGAVALMLQANRNLDHYEVKQILKDTALDLGAGGADNQYGFGRVDALAAVEAALAMGDCPGDFNGDGTKDILDFIAFQNAWTAKDPAADADGNGLFDILDFIAFQEIFQDPC
jgi:serine protease AprX